MRFGIYILSVSDGKIKRKLFTSLRAEIFKKTGQIRTAVQTYPVFEGDPVCFRQQIRRVGEDSFWLWVFSLPDGDTAVVDADKEACKQNVVLVSFYLHLSRPPGDSIYGIFKDY